MAAAAISGERHFGGARGGGGHIGRSGVSHFAARPRRSSLFRDPRQYWPRQPRCDSAAECQHRAQPKSECGVPRKSQRQREVAHGAEDAELAFSRGRNAQQSRAAQSKYARSDCSRCSDGRMAAQTAAQTDGGDTPTAATAGSARCSGRSPTTIGMTTRCGAMATTRRSGTTATTTFMPAFSRLTAMTPSPAICHRARAALDRQRADGARPPPADQLAQMCGQDSREIAGLPIDQIQQAIQPNDAQRAALMTSPTPR